MYGESQEDDFEMRESYTELRERWGVDASEDDPRPLSPVQASPSPKGKGKKRKGLREEPPARLLPNGMMNDLKSITELRSKGESRRFLDEVGYLFEGLDAACTLGVRRGRCAMDCVIDCVMDHAHAYTVPWRSSPSCVISSLRDERKLPISWAVRGRCSGMRVQAVVIR